MKNLLNQYIFHWSADKAIYIGGHSLLWDARCSGIYVGLGIGLIWHIISGRKTKNLPPSPILLVNTAMLVPMFVDLFSVWLNLRKPSNEIRLLTGILFGGAFSLFLYPAFVSFVISKSEGRPAINSVPAYSLFLTVSFFTFALRTLNIGTAFYIIYSISLFGFIGITVIFATSILKGLSGLLRKQKISQGEVKGGGSIICQLSKDLLLSSLNGSASDNRDTETGPKILQGERTQGGET